MTLSVPPLDYDELERWTRVGFERGMASRREEPRAWKARRTRNRP
jgi:hypothetical protein